MDIQVSIRGFPAYKTKVYEVIRYRPPLLPPQNAPTPFLKLRVLFGSFFYNTSHPQRVSVHLDVQNAVLALPKKSAKKIPPFLAGGLIKYQF